jgi:hypothetical protein
MIYFGNVCLISQGQSGNLDIGLLLSKQVAGIKKGTDGRKCGLAAPHIAEELILGRQAHP